MTEHVSHPALWKRTARNSPFSPRPGERTRPVRVRGGSGLAFVSPLGYLPVPVVRPERGGRR
jgi:hypothetical protein